MPIHRKINKKFFKKWSHDMAYIVGFMFADGNIVVTKRNTHFFAIYSGDKDLLKGMLKVMDSDHKLSSRKGSSENYRLQVGSKEMFSDLERLGLIPNKTKRMRLPEVPNKFVGDFVRGYFDGDGGVWMGYVHKERITPLLVIRTVFTSCSLEFLTKLKEALQVFAINKGVISKGKGNYYRLTYSVHSSLKLHEFMYNVQTSLFLKRKKVVFDKFVKLRV